MANVYDDGALTSHGRGRWFEPSIAHSGKVVFSRKNAKAKGRPGLKPGLLYTSPITVPLRRLTPHRRAARRLGGSFTRRRLRHWAREWCVGRQGDGAAVVRDIKRIALEQGVTSLPAVYLYPDTAPP
jgi:hypothetical protein